MQAQAHLQNATSFLHKSVLDHIAVKVRPRTQTQVLRGPWLFGSRRKKVCIEGITREAGERVYSKYTDDVNSH